MAPREVTYSDTMADDSSSDASGTVARRCDHCGEPVPTRGGYGSGSRADGLYCSLTCYAMKDDRYIPPLTDLITPDEDEPGSYES